MRKAINTLGIRETKRRFYELLSKAESGEEFTITKYGTPVARLIPLQSDDLPSKLPLATLDEPLRKAAKKAGVKLLGK